MCFYLIRISIYNVLFSSMSLCRQKPSIVEYANIFFLVVCDAFTYMFTYTLMFWVEIYRAWKLRGCFSIQKPFSCDCTALIWYKVCEFQHKFFVLQYETMWLLFFFLFFFFDFLSENFTRFSFLRHKICLCICVWLSLI